MSDNPLDTDKALDKLLPCDCGFLKGFAWNKGDLCEGCWQGKLKHEIKSLLIRGKIEALADLEVHHFDSDDNDDLYEQVVSPYVQELITNLEQQLTKEQS